MTPTRVLGLLLALLLVPACGDPTPARPDPRRGELVAVVDESAQVVGGAGARIEVTLDVERAVCPKDKKASRWRYEKFIHLPENEMAKAYDRAWNHWGSRGYHVERSPRRQIVRGRNDTFAMAVSPQRSPERTGFVMAGATVCPGEPGPTSPSNPASPASPSSPASPASPSS